MEAIAYRYNFMNVKQFFNEILGIYDPSTISKRKKEFPLVLNGKAVDMKALYEMEHMKLEKGKSPEEIKAIATRIINAERNKR